MSRQSYKNQRNADARHANNQYYGRQQSLKVTLEFLFATTEVHKYDPNDTSNLDPISVDEIQTCVTDYLDAIDPEAPIYGCASCGIWVRKSLHETPFQRPLNELSSLQFNEAQLASYNSVPLNFQRLFGGTKCKDGCVYALYRNLLTTPVDDRLDLKADNEVPLTAVALLCAGCYHSTSQRNQMIPIYSIKAGVDYTLQHIYLPPLSKLGVLMLSRYMPYGNIFQLATGRGAIAVKGSWVLMKTEVGSIVANLQKQHTDFLLHQEENQDSILFPRNPRDSGFKIMFTGPMDR